MANIQTKCPYCYKESQISEHVVSTQCRCGKFYDRGNIETFKQAEIVLKNIIQENPEIQFTYK